MNAVLDETGSGVGWRTVDLQNTALVARYALVLQVLDQRFRNRLADGFIVERYVKIRGRIRDRTVIGDDLDTLRLGKFDQRGGCRRVDRVKSITFAPCEMTELNCCCCLLASPSALR